MSTQIAGYSLQQFTPLNLGLDEALCRAQNAGGFLLGMLQMLEPQQVRINETAKESYVDCLQLREYLSEKLWAVSDNDTVTALQSTLDMLTRALNTYDIMNDAAEEGWYGKDEENRTLRNDHRELIEIQAVSC